MRRRFDRVLEEWVPEEELRTAWLEHLHNRAPLPSGPPAIRPLAFRGVTDAGSVVEVRGGKGEELEVWIDGTLIERVAARRTSPRSHRRSAFAWTRFRAHETFTASAEALDALADFSTTASRRRGTSHRSCSRTA